MKLPSRTVISVVLVVLGLVAVGAGSLLLGLPQFLVAIGCVVLIIALSMDVSQ